MLGFPIGGEQNTNLKYMVDDWGVALSLVRRSASPASGIHTLLDPAALELAIRTIMQSDGIEASRLRSRALHWKQVAIDSTSPPDGASITDLLALVHDLKHGSLSPPRQTVAAASA
jgi:hypothetical protein